MKRRCGIFFSTKFKLSSNTLVFFLIVAPEITVPSQLYGVGPGSNVTISCNVQAYPTAINYWMKDDNEMLLSG